MSTEYVGVAKAAHGGRRMMGLRLLGGRPSVLLLVVVKPASAKYRIVMPIPVALITALVETVGFWSFLLNKLGVRLPKTAELASHKGLRALSRFNIDWDADDLSSMILAVLKTIEELWMDLISHGSWTFVDVRSSSGDRVQVRFI
jgi:hypothetical protein